MKLDDLNNLESGSIIKYQNYYAVVDKDKVYTLCDGIVSLVRFTDFSKEAHDKELDIQIINSDELTDCISKDNVLKRAKKSRVLTNISWTCAKDWVDYLLYDRKNYLYKVYGRTLDISNEDPSFTFLSEDEREIYNEITSIVEFKEGDSLAEQVFSKTRRPEAGDDIGYFLPLDPNLHFENNSLDSLYSNSNDPSYIRKMSIYGESDNSLQLFERHENEVLCPTCPYLKRGVYIDDNTVYSMEFQNVNSDNPEFVLKKQTLLEFLTVKQEKTLFSYKSLITNRAFIFDHDLDKNDKEKLVGSFEHNEMNKVILEKIQELTKNIKTIFTENSDGKDTFLNKIIKNLNIISLYDDSFGHSNNHLLLQWNYWTNNIVEAIEVIEQSWRLRALLDVYNKNNDSKISIPEISKKIGKSYQTVYNWFNGAIVKPLSFNTVSVVADILKIHPFYLYFGFDSSKDKNVIFENTHGFNIDPTFPSKMQLRITCCLGNYWVFSSDSVQAHMLEYNELSQKNYESSCSNAEQSQTGRHFFELKEIRIDSNNGSFQFQSVTNNPASFMYKKSNECTDEYYSDLFLTKVSNDRMDPVISNGDFVVFKKIKDPYYVDHSDNNKVFILCYKQQFFLGRLFYDVITDDLLIKTVNPNYSDIKIDKASVNMESYGYLLVGKCLTVIKQLDN